jgi:hypothetical protein
VDKRSLVERVVKDFGELPVLVHDASLEESPQTYSRRLPSIPFQRVEEDGRVGSNKLIELFRHVLEQDSTGDNSEEQEGSLGSVLVRRQTC